MQSISRDKLERLIEDKLKSHYAVGVKDATDSQIMKVCAMIIREFFSTTLADSRADGKGKRQVHYLSMEFLVGRSLAKNAFNLEIYDTLADALEHMGRNASDIFESEPDAGLGNGGLGRLAACYMDSMATLGIPAWGYSICYEMGIFRQMIENGKQVEHADHWMEEGENWLVPIHEDAIEVRFGGHVESHWDYYGNYHAEHAEYTSVMAVPRDMLIGGYGSDQVNTLRLWEAKSTNYLDMGLFSDGEYVKSLEQRTMTEVITKILYPADNHIQGKTLRLKQQYFFVSATAQSITRKHRNQYGSIWSFADYNVIQINDTHPAMVIPELMRIFMDIDGLGWEDAWSIVTNCVAYTNHTVMSEALESWPQGLFQTLLPRIWEILEEINRRWREALESYYIDDMSKVVDNLIINEGSVSMANLCLAACFKVNGVSELHGDILKRELFKDVNKITPARFTFVTNGIDHRRWLTQINPRLHKLIVDLLGSDSYLREPARLEDLMKFKDDSFTLERLDDIKYRNKIDFASYVSKSSGINMNPHAVLDTQVKRLHEYKRQLMCAMLICHLQNELRENPGMEFLPRTFVFGAKAASGYHVAKRIIQLICSMSDDINSDPACEGRLQVVFLENYRVSVAEKLMPAAQVSQQISTAGKEASGTGNMKLMMNGAITIGTLDGANVEMYQELGGDNMFLFGLTAQEVALYKKRGYHPTDYCAPGSKAMRVLDRFNGGFRDGESYSDLASQLIYGGDEYMLLADFESYVDAHLKQYEVMSDPTRRSSISLVNIAKSGFFAADRSIGEYANRIWRVGTNGKPIEQNVPLPEIIKL